MKPYITDANAGGRYILPYQFEGVGIGYENIESRLHGACVFGYSMPLSQSLACVWEFRLYLRGGMLIDFSSTSASIGGWQEMGSLNIKFSEYTENNNCLDDKIYARVGMPDFCIQNIQSLVYSDETVLSESGIVFLDGEGSEVIVAAGVPPGSVSVSIPFFQSDFNPEMECDAYLRVPMKELGAYRDRG